MSLLAVRPLILLATVCLSGCIGLWQIDSVREAMRGSGPAAAVHDTLSSESNTAPASIEDDLWDVYPVLLEIREEIVVVPAGDVLLPTDPLRVPVHSRLIFHVPS